MNDQQAVAAYQANPTVGQLLRHPKGAAFIQNMMARSPRTASTDNLNGTQDHDGDAAGCHGQSWPNDSGAA